MEGVQGGSTVLKAFHSLKVNIFERVSHPLSLGAVLFGDTEQVVNMRRHSARGSGSSWRSISVPRPHQDFSRGDAKHLANICWQSNPQRSLRRGVRGEGLHPLLVG